MQLESQIAGQDSCPLSPRERALTPALSRVREREQCQRGFEDLHTVRNRLEETLFLLLQHLGDAGTFTAQLRIGLAHFGGQRRGQGVEERLPRAEFVAVADGAPRNAPQHIAATFIARNHTIGDGERAGTNVVGDDFQRRCIFVAPGARRSG